MSSFKEPHFRQIFMHWAQRANPHGFDESMKTPFKISGNTATITFAGSALQELAPALRALYSEATFTIGLKQEGKTVKVDFKFAGKPVKDFVLDRDTDEFDEPLQESNNTGSRNMQSYVDAL